MVLLRSPERSVFAGIPARSYNQQESMAGVELTVQTTQRFALEQTIPRQVGIDYPALVQDAVHHGLGGYERARVVVYVASVSGSIYVQVTEDRLTHGLGQRVKDALEGFLHRELILEQD